MQHRLQARVYTTDKLTRQTRESMFDLYRHYYGGVDKSLFMQDLEEKHQAIVLRDADDLLCGFTTLYISKHNISGQKVRSVFSGDTIVDHRYWGEQTLMLSWCQLAGQLKAAYPDDPLYWFLIVKGHRTYRYLRLFSHSFYPQVEQPTPSTAQILMDQMAKKRYGNAYDPESGLIRFEQTHGYLKPEWAGLDKRALQKTDVKFFLEKNPNYQCGDELVCLTELSEGNLRKFALRAFREGM